MSENKSYTYVLEHDTGFAPNPFFNYLTLAGCKPCLDRKRGVRRWIKKEMLDKEPVWIFANGGKRLWLENYEYRNGKLVEIKKPWDSHQRLVYAFRVNEILTFDEYYNDKRFSEKKRSKSSVIAVNGDNLFHNKKFIPEKQMNIYEEDPIITYENSNFVVKNTGQKNIYTDNVLISEKKQFYYFGCFAPNILSEFMSDWCKGIGSKSIDNHIIVNKIVSKLKGICPSPGIYGFPTFNAENYKGLLDRKDYLQEIYQGCFNPKTKNTITDWGKKIINKQQFRNQAFELVFNQ